ncbi:MAG TPA: transcription termination/antitermination NusG family protein [Hanamia sp.]|jgi:transcription antitermination factor NusG|nr:transcription termination/antitermination NusG family protein [Hanamia sp.]HZI69065.1 transcription termination/antitermination NusG family protein [Hanamia sp.]
MQKNWYAVYTKPHCERKISLSLSRKHIENFCPLNHRRSRQFFRSITSAEPIFKSYVFVKSTDEEIIPLTKKIAGIISVLYWKGRPATIKDEEINAMKEFAQNHEGIMVEKMRTNSKSEETDLSFFMDGQILLVKNRTMKLNIASLGLSMVAKLPEEKAEQSLLGNKKSFGNKELLLPS